MIDVYLHENGEHYTGFHVEGHAGYADSGKDIVCSAVSALTITLENALRKLSDVQLMEFRYVKDRSPHIFIYMPDDKTDLLVDMYRTGIEGIQEEYPDYVKLHLEI